MGAIDKLVHHLIPEDLDITKMTDDSFSLAERGVAALERIAAATERQADVMEDDIGLDEDRAEVQEATWIRRYGETLQELLDMGANPANAFKQKQGLRTLAEKMVEHGTDKTG